MPPALARGMARIRQPALFAVIAYVTVDLVVPDVPGPPWWGALLLVAGLLTLLMAGTVKGRAPVAVRIPVAGRWQAINSPASRVPSHGLQSYGQSHAIDLIHDPADDTRPYFQGRPVFRSPQDFPGFGRTVMSPGTGTVVRAVDRERDHGARISPLGLLFMFTVELFREFFGPRRVLGNHVIIDLGDGVYALLAHLRRGSVRVTAGQHVDAGDPIAECGNSGNTSEPHLHFHLMDHPRPAFAAGIPFRLHDTHGEELPTPKNLAHLDAPAP